MAFMECHFHSTVLGMACTMNVILPQPPEDDTAPVREAPCLYLLHGLSDDHSTWMRRTSIERYAANFGLAVIMPGVHRSFYADMAHGCRYWEFVSRELPHLVRAMFRVSADPSRTFVAGLSMGGYGAFKLALSYPDRFAAAASFSGVLDLVAEAEQDNRFPNDMRLVFGSREAVRGTPNDLCHLLEQHAAAGTRLPWLYQWCGTEDFLYPGNRRFAELARRLDVDLLYDEGSGGHAWSCWDVQAARFLELLRQRKLLAPV
ncbi:MAG: alpha/beta hydrolase [Kiritimatiellia bacterium]|nr:esterase family protein [Lentisphaerota bacterium]